MAQRPARSADHTITFGWPWRLSPRSGLQLRLLPYREPEVTHSHSIRSIGPGSASHYEIQQQQQQESAKMNIVL
eukprot:COSAG01_NODE_33534_length_562_cov_2.408207_1_plen_73_part_10